MILPFPLIVSSISLGVACLNLLILFFYDKKTKRTNNDFFLILFGLYTLLLDSITNSLREMNFDLTIKESRISFLIIPLVFWIGQKQLQKVRKKILLGVVFGVILYILYCICFLVYFHSFMTNRPFVFNHFLKYDLSYYLPGAYHHTYIGMYMTFSIIILTNKIIYKKNSQILLSILLIFACQIFIGGNLSIVLSFIVLSIFVFKQIKLTKIMIKWGLLLFLIIFLGFSYFSGIFDTITFSVNNRLESWVCSFKGFLNNSFVGLGNDVFSYLSTCINSDAISSHNQYLNELMTYGVFGFWVFFILYKLFKSLYKKNITKYFALLIIILCLTENILSLQRGIFFFSFFSSLFIYTNFQND